MLKESLFSIIGSEILAGISLAAYRHSPLVVLYHGVTGNTSPKRIENYRGKHVRKDAFSYQITWLKRHFEIVPLRSIEDCVQRRRYPDRSLCAITFDDGYRNNYTNAFPVLKRMGVPATIFLTTGFIDRKFPLWPDALEMSLGAITNSTISIPWDSGMKTYASR